MATNADPLWQEFIDDPLKHPDLEFGTWKARVNWTACEKFMEWARDNGYGYISKDNLAILFEAAEKALRSKR